MSRPVRWLAAASLISQIGIILTGGAVRLTASGLGCPDWPQCAPGTLTNTAEMGVHGMIEFGNRTLTFALGVIALALLVALWRTQPRQWNLLWLAVGLLGGIPAQAIIGGLSVWSRLNPWVVGLHFLVSAALVIIATVLLNRVYGWPRTPIEVRPLVKHLAVTVFVLVIIAVALGVVVTGSGPHAGDASAPRNGLSPELTTRLHVVPVYLLLATTIVLLVLARSRGRADPLLRSVVFLVVLLLAQGLIGYAQYMMGLPILLVELHLLGAALLLVAATRVLSLCAKVRR